MFRLFSRKNLERIKYVWGSGRIWGGSQVQHWLEHPLVQERINLKVSGTARLNRLDEFIGPSRFQWTDAQIQIMNEQLQQLPKHLRRLISDQSKFKERIVRKTVAYMAAADPSEAVRSSEIVPLLAQSSGSWKSKATEGRSCTNCCMTSQEIFARNTPDPWITYEGFSKRKIS